MLMVNTLHNTFLQPGNTQVVVKGLWPINIVNDLSSSNKAFSALLESGSTIYIIFYYFKKGSCLYGWFGVWSIKFLLTG